MNAIKTCVAIALVAVCTVADARGGASSGGGHGGGGGGHSSASSAGSRGGFSSAPASRPAPAPTPTAAPRPTAPAPAQTAARPTTPQTTTTTTTTRTINTSSRNVTPAGNYGGMGAGYYHNDGLLTGLIIGNMMHPHNTVVYTGGGAANNNALLYPDGRVVNQNGQQIGTYQNGQFTEMQNGPMAAQPIPQSALKPVEKETTVGEYFLGFMLVLAVLVLFFFLIGLLV